MKYFYLILVLIILGLIANFNQNFELRSQPISSIIDSINIDQLREWQRSGHYDSVSSYFAPRIQMAVEKNYLNVDLIRGLSVYLSNLRDLKAENIQDSVDYYKSVFLQNDLSPVLNNILDYLTIYFIFQGGEIYAALNLVEEYEPNNAYMSLIPDVYTDAIGFKAFLNTINEDNESALKYNQTADSLFLAHFPPDHKSRLTALNNYYAIYSNIGQYNKAKEYALKTYEIVRNNYDKSHTNYASILNNLSTIYWTTGELDIAINYLKEAIELNQKYERYSNLVSNYYNLAGIYLAKHDYEAAYQFLSLSLTKLRTNEQNDPWMETNILVSHVNYFMDLSRFDEAKLYLDELLEKSTEWFEPDDYIYTSIGVTEALFAYNAENYSNAIKLYEKVLPLIKYYYGDENVKTASTYSSLAECYTKLGNMPKAIDLMLKSKRIYAAALGPHHSRVNEMNYILANTYFQYGKLDSTQLNLNACFFDDNKTTSFEIQKFPAYEKLIKYPYLKETLAIQAKLISGEDASIEQLEFANVLYGYIDKEFTRLIEEYGGYQNRDDLHQLSSSTFRDAVELCHRLYQLTQEKKWIEQAFLYSEKIRGLKMQEIIRGKLALNIGGLPDSVVHKEQAMKAYMFNLNEQIKETSSDDKMIFNALQEEYLITQQNYKDFVKNIEIQYPKYYNLKYSNTTVTINEIQVDILSEEESLVQYCVKDTSLYVHIIAKNEANFIELPFPKSLVDQIHEWYINLSSNNKKSIDTLSVALYQQLFKPLEPYLIDSTIYIVPDELLHFVSFEALKKSYTGHDYLIKDYLFRYCYSPTVAYQEKKYQDAGQWKYDWVGFVPDFSVNAEKAKEYGLLRLPWAENVSQAVSKKFNGKLFAGSEANPNRFRTQASNGKLLHIGTHAVANDKEPLESYLVLQDENNDYYKMKAGEIFNVGINSKCAVLTACETAIGKIQSGEGMVSLSRAFEYAGCPNLVMTLWSVDDQQTSRIIERFYDNIAEDMDVSQALRKAKLHFINEGDLLLMHPFYWAGLMYSGQALIIEKSTPFYWYGLFGLGIIILISLTVYFLKRKF